MKHAYIVSDHTYLVLDNQLCRNTFSMLGQCTVLEHAVHVLAMEHVVVVTPLLLVVGKVVGGHWLTSLPVMADEVAENDWVSKFNVDFPVFQPSCSVGSA
jgi:hypothetical protein